MARSKCSTTVALIGLLLLAPTFSGCGWIGEMVATSMVKDQEDSEDVRLCKRRCAELKENDYTSCREFCMSEQREMRAKKKAQDKSDLERTEFEKQVTGAGRAVRGK
jgi:hypothetical protein